MDLEKTRTFINKKVVLPVLTAATILTTVSNTKNNINMALADSTNLVLSADVVTVSQTPLNAGYILPGTESIPLSIMEQADAHGMDVSIQTKGDISLHDISFMEVEKIEDTVVVTKQIGEGDILSHGIHLTAGDFNMRLKKEVHQKKGDAEILLTFSNAY
ncbi:MAG: hypothetical protein ACK4NC_03135 [Candidatus Gracilibacteria bacterium]